MKLIAVQSWPKLRTLCCVVPLIFVLTASSLEAQEADTAGWSSDVVNQTGVKQPGRVDIEPSYVEMPSDDVRRQIGLASFVSEEDGHSFDNGDEREEFLPSDVSNLFSADQFTSREGLGSSLKAILLLATLSLAPAIILMTTCYVRIVVVLTLLKQAFGAQQLPPTQVLTALALFITLLVMTPVWNQIKTDAIDPYTQADGISLDEAWERGIVPVKKFMANQIVAANNDQAVAVFYNYLPDKDSSLPTSAHDAPLNVLLPAFVVSELKVAFLLGFQIYLPFLVLDLVVSSVTVSTGMLMLPPTMVSFPLKLIMFVLVDGWNLVVGMLLQSFT